MPHQKSPSETATELNAALERVAAADRAAFTYVYQRTSAKLFGTCLRILHERQEAEEVLQEAYLTVWRRASSFDTARGNAMTWLITVTRNCAVDRLRATSSIASAPIDIARAVEDDTPLASDDLIDREDRARLTACLDTLEGGDALLIRTAFFEGSTYLELAHRAATPLGTIKSRIRRALIRLRECLR